MTNRVRLGLGLLLLFLALTYSGNNKPKKLEKPDDATIALIKRLPDIPDKEDAAKMSGIFEAMSKYLPDSVKTNYHVTSFVAKIGKDTTGGSLKGQYSKWAKRASELITEVIGSQKDRNAMSPEERAKLKALFHGFAWKLYNRKHDEVFEAYLAKAKQKIKEYDSNAVPDDDDDDESCTCNGTGYITHGDGHKTKCPCDSCDCSKMVEEEDVAKTPHKCQCDTEDLMCACKDEYGVCECPPVKEDEKNNNNDYNYSRRFFNRGGST